MAKTEHKLMRLIAKIEAKRTQAAELRDHLRDMTDELSSIIDSLDTADEQFKDGVRSLTDAVGTMSQYI